MLGGEGGGVESLANPHSCVPQPSFNLQPAHIINIHLSTQTQQPTTHFSIQCTATFGLSSSLTLHTLLDVLACQSMHCLACPCLPAPAPLPACLVVCLCVCVWGGGTPGYAAPGCLTCPSALLVAWRCDVQAQAALHQRERALLTSLTLEAQLVQASQRLRKMELTPGSNYAKVGGGQEGGREQLR